MWLLGFFGRWLLRRLVAEYGWQMLSTLAYGAVALVLTVIWSISIMAQPGGIYILASMAPPEIQAAHPLIPVVAVPGGDIDVGLVGLPPGAVSDADRFQLAMHAGWTFEQSIIATAVSIAEDGSGNPIALSAANRDGSRDFCLWQINSGWWPEFGGQQALSNPQTCANAAHVIFTRQGWCAWSTYGSVQLCGNGHNDSYLAFLQRATVASHQR